MDREKIIEIIKRANFNSFNGLLMNGEQLAQEILELIQAGSQTKLQAKITVLKTLKSKKPLPKTDEDWTPEYQRGWDSLHSKIGFELQRNQKLLAEESKNV